MAALRQLRARKPSEVSLRLNRPSRHSNCGFLPAERQSALQRKERSIKGHCFLRRPVGTRCSSAPVRCPVRSRDPDFASRGHCFDAGCARLVCQRSQTGCHGFVRGGVALPGRGWWPLAVNLWLPRDRPRPTSGGLCKRLRSLMQQLASGN